MIPVAGSIDREHNTKLRSKRCPSLMSSIPESHVRQIKTWFEKAVPIPNDRSVHTQIGVHLEEITEMLEVLRDAGKTFTQREQLAFITDVLGYAQRQFKAYSDGIQVEPADIDRVSLLDALCDQIVTAIGVAHMMEMDIIGALKEVANSNDSKFGSDGNPIFNEHRKIMKGPEYFPPNLAKYV
jgi:predicted HAD superfamily Cof-like phosphohydrolase